MAAEERGTGVRQSPAHLPARQDEHCSTIPRGRRGRRELGAFGGGDGAVHAAPDLRPAWERERDERLAGQDTGASEEIEEDEED